MPRDLTPFYVTEQPNQAITISESEDVELVHENSAHRGLAEVSLQFLPSPSLVIKARFDADSVVPIHSLGFGPHLLRFVSRNTETEVIVTELSTEYVGTMSVQATLVPNGEMVSFGLTDRPTIREVRFHVVNFLNFYSHDDQFSNNRSFGDETTGRWQLLGATNLAVDGWRITLSALPTTSDLEKALRAQGGYAITHVGTVKREDDDLFSVDQAKDLLDCLHYFLSFARGFWVSLVLPVGLSQEGERVWQEWGITLIDRWRFVLSWFDGASGQLLKEVFPGFWRRWTDSIWNEAMRMAIYWYVESNTKPADTGVALSQFALELLDKLLRPGSGEQECRRSSNRPPAGKRFKGLLDSLAIPTQIPASLSPLAFLAREKGWSDGPEAFAGIRNKIVHADTMNQTPLSIRGQAWKLGQWYLEMVLLRLFGHVGRYANRLSYRHRGQTDLVPWAAESDREP
jgi:hypothetical protein